MKLSQALAVAKQMCNLNHPATIRSKAVAPKLLMIQVSNGNYLTSQSTERAKKFWSFENFVKEFDTK